MPQIFTDDCYSLAHQAVVDLQCYEDNFAALKSCFSGTGSPSNPVAGMWWLDTTNHILKHRNEANNAWLSVWDMVKSVPLAPISSMLSATAWRLLYSNASKLMTEIDLGELGQILTSNGNTAEPGFADVVIPDASITGAKLLQPTVSGMEITLGLAPTERSSSSQTYVKLKELAPLTRGGKVTVTFLLKCGANYTAYGKIYVNDVAVGTEQTMTNTTYVSKSGDITVAIGDVIQIFGKVQNGGITVYIKSVTVTANDPYVAREVNNY
jgi:hypothetical protein